jgi:hypothetical protein
MPRLLEQREIHLEFSDIDRMLEKRRIGGMKRSSGIHLSGIIKHVLTAAGQLTGEDLGDMMPLRMAVGMAWEMFCVQLWPELDWQPGEVTRDNVIGSPDGVSGDVLEEIKATWMSRLEKTETKGVIPPPRNIIEIKRWMLQLAGYLYMMGLNKARMHVLWVNGDYRNSGPQYFTYLLEFSQQELERIWNNLVLPNRAGAKAEEH